MLFELPRDFPSLFLALRDLFESGQGITPTTVTEELLAGDDLDEGERATLESEVAVALFALSTSSLLQSEHLGVICPQCGTLTLLVEAPSRAWFLEKASDLLCPKCERSSARAAWRWHGNYQFLTDQTLSHSEAIPLTTPVYLVPLPDGTSRTITTGVAFWQAVDDAARWYLQLPLNKRALVLADHEGGLPRQIGVAVANRFTPADASAGTVLLQIAPSIWGTSYPHALADDDEDSTPAHIFDVTLREMIIEHLAIQLGSV